MLFGVHGESGGLKELHMGVQWRHLANTVERLCVRGS